MPANVARFAAPTTAFHGHRTMPSKLPTTTISMTTANADVTPPAVPSATSVITKITTAD